MDTIFKINDREFVFNLSLETDELCAPIEREMLKEIPETFFVVAESLSKIGDLKRPQTDEEWETAKKLLAAGVISIGYNMLSITNWLREKKYLRKLMAILLKPKDEEFNESDIPEREKFMAKYATRQISREVVQHFFLRSGG